MELEARILVKDFYTSSIFLFRGSDIPDNVEYIHEASVLDLV